MSESAWCFHQAEPVTETPASGMRWLRWLIVGLTVLFFSLCPGLLAVDAAAPVPADPPPGSSSVSADPSLPSRDLGADGRIDQCGTLPSGVTTWTTGNVYVLTCDVRVPVGGALVIEPGTVVKFAGGYQNLYVDGTLQAEGSASSPIAFTSMNDDAHGGDTANNGASTPGPNEWGRIQFNAGSRGRLAYAFIGYGGYLYSGGYPAGMVQSYSNDLTLDHVTLKQSGQRGLYAEKASVSVKNSDILGNLGYGLEYNGLSATVPLTVTGNVFTATGKLGGMLRFDGQPHAPVTFQGNRDSAGESGFSAQGTISGTVVWDNGSSLPLVVDGDLTIGPTATLRLQPGTVMKFADSYQDVFVNGTLLAEGTAQAPIAFTSMNDDAHGGDTANNGASTPGPNEWGRIQFNAGSRGRLAYAFIGYGGYLYSGGYPAGMVQSYSSDLTLDHVTLKQSGQRGLYAEKASVSVKNSDILGNLGYGLEYNGLSAAVPLTVTGNVFTATGKLGGMLRFDGQPHAPVTFQGNRDSAGESGFSAQGTISGTVVWDNGSSLPLVVDGDLTIGPTATLRLQPGTVMKFADSYQDVFVNGTLLAEGTAQAPIAFTSMNDDAHGGDTANNGASTPGPNEWGRIQFNAGSRGRLAYAFIGYGGYLYSGGYPAGMVQSYSGDVTLNNITLQLSGQHGLYCENAPLTVHASTLISNTGYAIYNQTPAGEVDARFNYWGQPSGPTHPSNPGGRGGRVTDGVLFMPWAGGFTWVQPINPFAHGVQRVEWAVYGRDVSTVTVQVILRGPGQPRSLGDALPASGGLDWDTRGSPDGAYGVQLIWHDAASRVLEELNKQVLVLNSSGIVWHAGRINANETWAAGKVHVLSDDVTIAGGVRVTVSPGAVIKAAGVRLIVEDGGTLQAQGTALQPIIFTALADDTAGGDTNLDGDGSQPHPGDWWGVQIRGTGSFGRTAHTSLRYVQTQHGGTLSASETWSGTDVHRVNQDIIVPSGVVLTLEPGTVVKFGHKLGVTVQAGGQLIAGGTVAQPIVFTSLRDDAVGGDTNADGDVTAAAAGDWRWLYVDGGRATLDHVQLFYGGGTSSGNWEQTGVLRTNGNATVLVANSIIREAFFDGVLAWGGSMTISNTLLTGNDRAICAHPGSTVQVLNSTVDDNRTGLLIHGGVMNVVNTIVSHNSGTGILHDYGPDSLTIRYSDLWNPTAANGNYSGTADKTGSDGNRSEDPSYVDRAGQNYRLGYSSPAIDAADGPLAPATDMMGAPRYDDPRTPNTGTRTAGGAYADMGAYEFVETAASNLDLVVTGVVGPASAVAGEQATLAWTVTNIGSEPAVGPWRDTARLVLDGDPSVALDAGQVLVGQGVILGPGQSTLAGGTVRVPGGVDGSYHWQVTTNTGGEVFEGQNAGNNTGASVSTVSLGLPELALGGAALSRTFAAAGQAHWFMVKVPANQTVRVALDRAGATGVTELYLGRDVMPARDNYDLQLMQADVPDASILASSGSAATVLYILAYPRSLPAGGAGFTISARLVAAGVDSFSPVRVGNNGRATLTLRGSQLSAGLSFKIVEPGGAAHAAAEVLVPNPTLALATFDLGGLPAGCYDLLVQAGAATVTRLNDALTVEAGSRPSFSVALNAPALARAGRQVPIVVSYQNTGNSDVRLPFMTLFASGGELRYLRDADAGAGSLTFLAPAVAEGSAVLPPGARGEVTFYCTVPPQSSGLDFRLYADSVDDPAFAAQPLDWAQIGNAIRPAGANASAWAAYLAAERARYGGTFGDLFRFLSTQMRELSQGGLPEAVFVNGEWLSRIEPNGHPRPLPPSATSFAGTAAGPSAQGDGASALAACPAGDGVQKIHVLMVADEDYSARLGSVSKNLPGCLKDQAAVKQLFQGMYNVPTANGPGGSYTELTDKAGKADDTITPAKVQQAIRDTVAKADADDMVVVWNTSHGTITQNGDVLSNPVIAYNGGDLTSADLNNAFAGACSQVLFVNDSCYSGALAATITNPKVTSVSASFINQSSHDWAFTPAMVSALQKAKSGNVLRAFQTAAVATRRDHWAKHHATVSAQWEPLVKNDAGMGDLPTWEQVSDPTWWAGLSPADRTKYQKLLLVYEQAQSPRIYNADENNPPAFDRPDAKKPAAGQIGGKQKAGAPKGQARMPVVGSYDPNDKVGPSGFAGSGRITTTTTIPYTIHFENDPRKATAPAQVVVVTDTLDPALDWRTLELGQMGFGSTVIEVPAGRTTFSCRVALSDTLGIVVDVTASYEPATRLLRWEFRTVDDRTGELPEDPLAGFLPPNDASHRGEGWVSFTIRPEASLPDGTSIRNRAMIVFDVNPPLATNEVLNTIGPEVRQGRVYLPVVRAAGQGPSASPTPTRTATRTATPTSTASATATRTATRTSTATPTSTASATATRTATRTATGTPTSTATATPTPTATRTATGTPTSTTTATPTPTATRTATVKPADTPGPPGCYGRVTVNSAPVAGAWLHLGYSDGAAWSFVLTTTTAADGRCLFSGMSSLRQGQAYLSATAQTAPRPRTSPTGGAR